MRNKYISYRQSASIREFFIVFGYCGMEEILSTAYLPLWFSIIVQVWTSSIYSEKMMLVLWEIKHISYRQSVRIREFFIVFGYCGIEEILNTAYLLLWFSIILQVLTSSIYSEKMMLVLWEIKHISYRQSVRIREFFIVFGYCRIEEILNTAYLLLWFSIILQVLTSSIYSEKMMLVLCEINTYHTDKVPVYVSFS